MPIVRAKPTSPGRRFVEKVVPVDLARALAELLDDADRLVACSVAAFGRAREQHTADKMAAAHEQLYAEVRLQAK